METTTSEIRSVLNEAKAFFECDRNRRRNSYGEHERTKLAYRIRRAAADVEEVLGKMSTELACETRIILEGLAEYVYFSGIGGYDVCGLTRNPELTADVLTVLEEIVKPRYDALAIRKVSSKYGRRDRVGPVMDMLKDVADGRPPQDRRLAEMVSSHRSQLSFG